MRVLFIGDNNDEKLAVQMAVHSSGGTFTTEKGDISQAELDCVLVGQLLPGHIPATIEFISPLKPNVCIASTGLAPREVTQIADQEIADIEHGIDVVMRAVHVERVLR